MQLNDIEWYHFSAHAHRKDLVGLVKAIHSKNLIFVHGDPPALDWMHDHVGDGRNKFLRRIGESLALDA